MSQSHREKALHEGFSVTATERVAMASNLVPLCSTEPLGGTGRLSLEPVLLAVSFFGLARSNFCLSGRSSSEPADFAAVPHSASSFGMTHSHFCSSMSCSSVRSFVPVLFAACSRKCNGDAQAAMLHGWGNEEKWQWTGQKLRWSGAWRGVMKWWQGRDVKWVVFCFSEHSQLCAWCSPLRRWRRQSRFGAHYRLRWRELVSRAVCWRLCTC